MESIPLHDWISLIVGVLGLVTAWISRSGRLPKPVRDLLGKIKIERIISAIDAAQTFTTKTPAERREWAVKRLQVVVRDELGIELPTSVANVLVEYGYQIYKKRFGR